MSYSITYPWDRERELTKKRSGFPAFLPGFFLIAGILLMRLLVPEIDLIVSQLLHPLFDAHTMEAAGNLVTSLKEGLSLEEAVTAFCVEILHYG